MQNLPASIWELLGAIVVGFGGVITLCFKLINSLRSDNKELQNQIITQVLPAMNSNTEASKQLVTATQQVISAVAVAKDREQRVEG